VRDGGKFRRWGGDPASGAGTGGVHPGRERGVKNAVSILKPDFVTQLSPSEASSQEMKLFGTVSLRWSSLDPQRRIRMIMSEYGRFWNQSYLDTLWSWRLTHEQFNRGEQERSRESTATNMFASRCDTGISVKLQNATEGVRFNFSNAQGTI